MSARETIENLWNRAIPVGPLLDAVEAEARAVPSAVPAPATDRAEAVASCPGRELDPNPCRCPCYGCKHHRSAHNPDALEDEPAAGRAGLREQIAEALYERERPPRDAHWPDVYASDRETFEEMADAVLAVLRGLTLRELELLYRPNATPSRPEPRPTPAEEAYRLTLSTALRLGTAANWEAIRDRAEDLVAEVQQLTAARRRFLDQQQSTDGRAATAGGFVVWLDASDGSVPTHDGVQWPDGRATVRHRHYGHTTTHHSPEAAAHSAHGKQARIVWPTSADRATVLNEAAGTIAADAALRETEGEYALAEYGYELARLIRPKELRRLAVEARDGQTTQDEAPCSDPIECGHEAALGQAEAKLDTVHALGLAWSRPSMSAPTQVAGEHLLRLLASAPDSDDALPAVVPGGAGEEPAHETRGERPSVPCSRSVLRQPHTPHKWQPQSGMDWIDCPGSSGWEMPDDHHSCADSGCTGEPGPAVPQPGKEPRP